MAISPTGFSNHLALPLSQLVMAALQARLADRADERRFVRADREDAQAEHARMLSLAMDGARAGHAVEVPTASPTEQGVLEAILAQGEADRGRRSAEATDQRVQRGLENQWRQRREWREERASTRADQDAATGRIRTLSQVGDTWADNIGAVLEGAAKRIFPGRSAATGKSGVDPTKALREAAATWEISNGAALPRDVNGNIDWTDDTAQSALPQINRIAAQMAGISVADPAAAPTEPAAPAPATPADPMTQLADTQRRGAPPAGAAVRPPVPPTDGGLPPVDAELAANHATRILATPPGPQRVTQIAAELQRLKRLNPALYAQVAQRIGGQ